jgi:ABC-2 type transport system permease protein
MHRTAVLLRKELIDLRQHPGIFLPAILTGIIAFAMPFIIAIVIPAAVGETLAGAVHPVAAGESTSGLDPEGVEQAAIFRQFLILLMLSPIAASMSVAAWSVVGEKQARTLEPLLATPLTTFELLAAKTLSALLPAIVFSSAMFLLYVATIAVVARPGVAGALAAIEPVSVVFLLAPLASLAALQLTICMSSRSSDPRSAQQLGALVILPLAALLVLQLTGAVQLGVPLILTSAILLVLVNLLLARIAIRLFGRESILTRWK